MTKSKRMLSLFFAVSLGLTPIVNCTFDSNKVYATKKNDEEDVISSYAEELKFYFETVGHFDDSGNYVVTNLYLLKQKALSGDDFAKFVLHSVRTRSLNTFLWCVLKDQTYGVLDFLDGEARKGLITALAGGSWLAAGKIIYSAMIQVGKDSGKATNIFFTAASIAISVYSCRNEY